MVGQEDYEKLIDYIEQQLFEKKMKIGDRLPAERELSAMLNISRGSVRVGLAVLVAIGVVVSRHGSGNYINGAFDHKLTQIMTMMYALDDMSDLEVYGFRYAAEQEALLLAMRRISSEEREALRAQLQLLLTDTDPAAQILHDQTLHRLIVEASGSRLVVARYMALNKMLDVVIGNVRQTVREMGHDDFERLQQTHEALIEGICTGDYPAAKKALDDHFQFTMAVVEAGEAAAKADDDALAVMNDAPSL